MLVLLSKRKESSRLIAQTCARPANQCSESARRPAAGIRCEKSNWRNCRRAAARDVLQIVASNGLNAGELRFDCTRLYSHSSKATRRNWGPERRGGHFLSSSCSSALYSIFTLLKQSALMTHTYWTCTQCSRVQYSLHSTVQVYSAVYSAVVADWISDQNQCHWANCRVVCRVVSCAQKTRHSKI